MKRIILYTLIAALTLALLMVIASCSRSHEENEILKAIAVEDIVEITASTQITDQKQDTVLEREEWEDFLDKLNSLSLRRTTQEMGNGWQYLFRIEQKEDVVTLIIFSEDKVKIGETVYQADGYREDDFLYLFE